MDPTTLSSSTFTLTRGTAAHLQGVVLCQTSITMGTGASVMGRMMAQTALDIDGATVVEPAP